MRKTRRVCILDVTEVRKERIVVFHGNKNVIDEVYRFSSQADSVIVECNKKTDSLAEKVRERTNI